MKNLFTILGFASVTTVLSFIQPDPPCSSFRNGRFHTYDKASQTHFVIIRSDSLQTEIDTKTGDTTFCKIEWQSDCTFRVLFINTTKYLSENEKYFRQKSNITATIVKTSKDYYVHDVAIKYMTFSKTYRDTTWVKGQ